jgi:thiamine-monophosphate kinase
MTKFAELGEFGLIERIRQIMGAEFGILKTGIGDDCAVFESPSGNDLLFTTDALVEGVHFDMAWTPAEALGWKALAVNLSDIAAMGGEAVGAVISIALPETWTVERVEGFYRGIRECSVRFACPIAGGDTVKSMGQAFISIAVLGRALKHPILRSGSKPGDLVCVTGSLGGSRTGWESLSADPGRQDFPDSIQHFLRPIPRMEEARILVEKINPTSLIDISDGLSSELIHLCQASETGCVLREADVPVTAEARRWAERQALFAPAFAMDSGEEYELLFTIPSESVGLLTGLSFAITVIGEMTNPETGMLVVTNDGTRPLSAKGWDHFGS